MKADATLRVLIALSLVLYAGLGAALVYGAIVVDWLSFSLPILFWACFARPLIRDARKDWYV